MKASGEVWDLGFKVLRLQKWVNDTSSHVSNPYVSKSE